MSDSSIRGSIRQRLLSLALLPLLFIIPCVVAMAYWWSAHVDYRQLLMKANTDLSVAEETLQATRNQYLLQLAVAVETLSLKQWLVADAKSQRPLIEGVGEEQLADSLEQLRIETGLDFIRLLTPEGCDWLDRSDCGYPDSPVVTEALEGRPYSNMELFSAEQLAYLDPALAEKAVLPLIATDYAHPTNRTDETRGMMMHVAYPLLASAQEPVALVVGGLMMNGNITFVDQIKSTVYGEGSLLAGGRGAVTLFLEDVRISTNVPDKQDSGGRALGTRVSEEVRTRVLDQGERWLDRAFVVSDWYVSAYAPIKDGNGQRIGMLYSGFLESPYKDEFYRSILLLLGFLITLFVLSGWWAINSAKTIFRPLEMMATVINRIRQGQRTRLEENQVTHELQVLATEFNQMLQQLETQHDQIQRSADQLELKVAERTDELQQHIRLLQRTREQLVAKGKLAAIGELTAGIAHEINNPTAVILGYLDLMMVELGEAGKPVAAEAQLIIEQVDRIRNIINNLLQYSRPDDYQAELGPIDINQVILSTVPLVKHDLSRNHVRLTLDLQATQQAVGLRQPLQQILINLIVNGGNAMPEGGELILRSRDWRGKGVMFAVIDNGCGMDKETLSRIFDPFFSKTQGGTGLGLAVSQTLLQRLQATIRVRSKVGKGSGFYIWLQPVAIHPGQIVSIPRK